MFLFVMEYSILVPLPYWMHLYLTSPGRNVPVNAPRRHSRSTSATKTFRPPGHVMPLVKHLASTPEMAEPPKSTRDARVVVKCILEDDPKLMGCLEC